MQLKRQSVEAWQNEKHCSKENNTSENPIPRREILKQVDHVKYEGQDRSQHLLFVQFFSLSFQAVAEGIGSRNFYFITVQKLFSTIFIRSGKMHHVELNSGTSKSSN